MSTGNTVRTHCLECDPDRRKSKSLARTTDERGVVEYCHRCQYTRAENIARQSDAKIVAQVEPVSGDKLAAIWARTQSLRGTIGETYLKHRRCVIPPADSDLRFLPGNDRFPPSLCALVTNAITNEPQTLHFTRLRADGLGKAGTDRDKLLLKGHPKSGGVIRLWPDDAVTTRLGVAEGIETALCAAHGYKPMWSTVDAGNLSQLPVLAAIETLLIFADNDKAGLTAARHCGRRWASAKCSVRLVIPRLNDFADEVAEAG